MNKNNTDGSIRSNRENTRSTQILLFSGVFVAVCILFFTAFRLFRPDQLSLSDKYFPSPTATPTRTPSPTPTPNLTATQKALDSLATVTAIHATVFAASQWKMILLELFIDNQNNWPMGEENYDRLTVTREIQGGKYIWNATAKDGFVYWVTPSTTEYSQNFFASVDCKVDGPPNAECGLIFRRGAENYYIFNLENSGRYNLFLRYNDEWVEIIKSTPSPLIKTNEVNRITVIGQGSHFIFLVNDTFLIEVYDARVTTGYVTMAISLTNEGDHAIFEFDNFEVRAP